MADPLYDLLIPYFDSQNASANRQFPSANDPVTSSYLSRLTALSLSSLTSTEPQALSQQSQSLLRSLQALSKRSHKSIIAAADDLTNLRETLPVLARTRTDLQNGLPGLENEAQGFSEKYNRAAENPTLERRRNVLLLARNIDRVSDVLDLPTLLSSAIASSSATAQALGGASAASPNVNYASALDIYAYIKRLHTLYPSLAIISMITAQAEEEMKGMTTHLIASLQGQGLKLAGAMRTIGWLRRVAPELDEAWSVNQSATIGSNEGALGALFLVCRLANLVTTLDALEPLRELADQESDRRAKEQAADAITPGSRWSGGQQTERYLKRYLEIFREQSFAIISMYKSIFPSALPQPVSSGEDQSGTPPFLAPGFADHGSKSPQLGDQSLTRLPSALATFTPHLVDLLFETLRRYLPNVQDRASRDSLLTQVLYCAGSLGRLGGDFGMMLALLDETADESDTSSEDEEEWVEIMKKHRVQASRLELLASGVASTRTASSSKVPLSVS